MGLNRILDLLGLPTLAHQDSCMQLFYCWVCTCCFMTLDPGPLWLSKSFFRLASDLCLGKERMEMSQSLCPALVLLWCYNMVYNFSDNLSLDIASLSMVHALSKSRIFSVLRENTMWHHFPACSGICNEWRCEVWRLHVELLWEAWRPGISLCCFHNCSLKTIYTYTLFDSTTGIDS